MSFDDPEARSHPNAGDIPPWSLVSVADPQGTGTDGAFTCGLAELGLPELVLWARPSHGTDPGADWLLTHEDRMAQLNRWANELVAGLLSPDAVQQCTFDHGGAVVTFRFGPPEPAGRAGIADLPPDCPVIVVGWSLARRTAPSSPDPSSASIRRVSKWLSRAQVISAGWRARGVPVRGAAPAATSRAEYFGPMSGWVLTRIEQLLGADQLVLADFFERIPAAAMIRCDHCLRQELLSLASRHGRGGPAREVINASQFLVPALTDSPGGAWDLLVEQISRALMPPATPPSMSSSMLPPPAPEFDDLAGLDLDLDLAPGLGLHSGPHSDGHSDPHSDRSSGWSCAGLRDTMEERLCGAVEALLLAATVADLAPVPLTASASGCWEWAVSGGRVPGRAWLAPVSARSATRSLLIGPDGENRLIHAVLASSASGWEEEVMAAEWADWSCGLPPAGPADALESVFDEPSAWPPPQLPTPADRAIGLITGLQTTGPASARPGWLLSPATRARLTRRQARLAESLAAPLLAAAARPTELHPDTWPVITAPLRRHLPELPEQVPGWGVLM